MRPPETLKNGMLRFSRFSRKPICLSVLAGRQWTDYCVPSLLCVLGMRLFQVRAYVRARRMVIAFS